MCTGVEIALIAGAAVSAGTAIYTGAVQEDAEDARAAQADADAEAAAAAGRVEARKIREAAKAQRSAAVSALAASGVAVQTGTAEQIQTDIERRGEEDALTAILEGRTRSRFLEREGQEARLRGDQAMTAGYLNATSSVLSSVAASQRQKPKQTGWKGTNTNADYWDFG